MADRAIAAADVTFNVLSAHDYRDYQSGAQKRIVHGLLAITADATNPAVLYPAGDIPLTNLFTANSGSDTLLDVTRPVEGICGAFKLNAGTTAPAAAAPSLRAYFANVGVTAATKLLCLEGPSSAATGPRLSYTAATISAANADSSVNDSATAFPAFVVGEPILVSGFTGTAANNQVGVVVSRTTAKIVLTVATAFVNDAAGESVTLTSLWPLASGHARLADNADISGANLLGADTTYNCFMTLIGDRRVGSNT